MTTAVTKQLQANAPLPAASQGLQSATISSIPTATTELPLVGESSANDSVSQAVHSLHSSIAGEGHSLPGRVQPREVFTSVNLPVDSCVPAKLKTKTWQDEFIDFGSLLTNHALDGKYQLTIHNSGEGSSPSLALEPVHKPKKIVSIDTWVQAFHIFVGVYTARYPN